MSLSQIVAHICVWHFLGKVFVFNLLKYKCHIQKSAVSTTQSDELISDRGNRSIYLFCDVYLC